MDPLRVVVFATIAAAVMCWAMGELRSARRWWAAGAALAVVHSAAAFGVFYQWSHALASRLTDEQTVAVTGVSFSGGIYVNYVFLAVWVADAVWWYTAPRRYVARPLIASVLIRGFIFFIIVNGAVIFADGWARIVGLLCTSAVLASWLLKLWSRRGAFSTVG